MIWIGVIIAVIILPDLNMHYQNVMLKLDRLPKAYRSYSSLAEIKDDTYDVVDFFSAQSVLQLNDSTIAIVTNAINQNTNDSLVIKTWYKINLKGVITDSLALNYQLENSNHLYKTFNNYIVDVEANTYSSWLTDSDTTRNPIENTQPNKIYSSAEVGKIISAENYVHSAIIPLKNSDEDYMHKLIFYRNGNFHTIYVEKNWSKFNDATNNSQVKYESSSKNNDKESANLKRVYVHKEQWIDASFWNLSEYLTMWTGGGLGRKRWEGTAYYDLQLPKKKLHFKEAVIIEYPDQYVREPFNYKIYKPKNGEYELLSEGEYFKTYLIRPRKPSGK